MPTYLNTIALSYYKTVYTAQLLYITSVPTFGQPCEIQALISGFELSPAVWNVMTPEDRDRVKKKHCLEQKDLSTVLRCLHQWFLSTRITSGTQRFF